VVISMPADMANMAGSLVGKKTNAGTANNS
jgi:hypothetical protein